jgi:hypothetical protein
MSTPFEMIGDAATDLCVDGMCAVPGPRPPEKPDPDQPPHQQRDADERTDDLADAGPGGRVPVQR